MSNQDRILIKRCQLKQTDVASLLGITDQALSKGICAKKDYLNFDRWRKIYKDLKDKDDRKAFLVGEVIQELFGVDMAIEELDFGQLGRITSEELSRVSKMMENLGPISLSSLVRLILVVRDK